MQPGRLHSVSHFIAGLVIAVAFMHPASSFAQDFERLPVGARVQAMGGTGVATVTPGEAAAINPAWMIGAESLQLTLHTRARWNSTPPASEAAFTYNDLSSGLAVDYAAVVLPGGTVFSRPIALGAHIGTPLGMLYREWESSGTVYSFGPAFAVEPMNGLTSGATFNVWRGRIQFDHPVILDRTGSYVPLPDHTDLSGYNATVGVGYSFDVPPHARFHLGVALHTPLTLTLNNALPVSRNQISGAVGVRDAQLPWQSTYGYSFRWKDVITATFEFEYSPESETTPGSHRGFRVGGEYVFRVGEIRLPLRAGVRSVTTTQIRQNITSAWGWSAGGGMELNGYRLDIAWSSHYQDDYDSYINLDEYTGARTRGSELGTLAVGVTVPLDLAGSEN